MIFKDTTIVFAVLVDSSEDDTIETSAVTNKLEEASFVENKTFKGGIRDDSGRAIVSKNRRIFSKDFSTTKSGHMFTSDEYISGTLEDDISFFAWTRTFAHDFGFYFEFFDA